MIHLLIAPNAFKNSLDALQAAKAIQTGIMESNLPCTTECFPIGDGGDGTGELIIEKLAGIRVPAAVHDPLGRRIESAFGLVDNGHTAVIEMANASGIRLLDTGELAPLHTSTFGTGEMIRRALDAGVKRIIIGMGGSATVDGGMGILNALGIRFFNAAGEVLPATPQKLLELNDIDASGLDPRILACEVVVLCDVGNYLLGEQGAAAVFGPQKGATAEDVKKLETLLSNFRETALKQTGKDMATVPHGGTAGGAAAGLWAFLNAQLVNGGDYFLQLTGFDDALKRSDIVITGEGSIDEQTLSGKGPYCVASQARLQSVPVIALAGKIPLEEQDALSEYFEILLAIGNEPVDISIALQCTEKNLIRSSRQIGNLLALLT